MTTDEWHKIEAIVDKALQLPVEKRNAFIISACDDEPELIRQVKEFLASVSDADRYFSSNQAIKKKLESEVVSTESVQEDYKSWIGTEIGAYTLTDLLGEGGMGAVFLGERTDGQFEHSVAIKIIRGGLNRDAIYTHFIRERQILARLNHENIARLYGGGVTSENIPYLIMEYVDGTPIVTYCDEHRLNAESRISLFKDVCRAAGYAHKNLVIHRDLKPENILITNSGKVKVMDFGIAKLSDPSKSERFKQDKITHEQPHSSRYLSFLNCAPELIEGDSATTASDIYSLGCLLYKLLSGSYPLQFSNKQPADALELIKYRSPLSLDEHFNQLSEPKKLELLRDRSSAHYRANRFLNDELNAIVQKCLAKDPSDRYQTIDDLLQDLERYRSDFPVQACDPSFLYKAKKYTARNTRSLSIVALFLLISLFAGLFYASNVQKERDIARLEATKATQVTEFVLDLFEGSNPSNSGASDISARDLLNRGIERTQYLSNQPQLQANMFEVLGRILTQLGTYDEADELLQKSIDIRKKLFGENHLETVSSYEQMGTLMAARGNLFDALTTLENAIKIREMIEGENEAAMSEANLELAYVYRRLGKFERAEEIYRRLTTIYTEELGADDPLTLTSQSSLGVTLHTAGDLLESESIYRDVLTRRLNIYDVPHPDVAMSYNNLGSLLINKGRFSEAEELLTKSLEMRRALFGNTHPKVSLTLNNLGIVNRNRGNFEQAISQMTRSLSINRGLFGDDALQTGMGLFSLAELHLMTGQFDLANQHFKESHNIFRKHLPEGSSFTARSLIGLGQAGLRTRETNDDLERAADQIMKGFERVQQIHPEASIEYGLAAVAMGELHISLGRQKTGLDYLAMAHHIISQIEGKESTRSKSIEKTLLSNGEEIVVNTTE